MRISVVFLSFAALLAAACGGDITPGSKFAGQTCYVDDDCRGALICVARVCTPVSGGAITDGGTIDDGGTTPDVDVPEDMSVLPDLGGDCELGERRCLGESRRAECVETDEGNVYTEFSCPAQTVCEAGRCVGDAMCMDQDGDGYGEDCPAGPDCEDRVASINPGAMESCATPFDDNCDGRINEGCPVGGCCPNGCSDGEFCSSMCVCESFDPDVCTFQNQPCSQEGIFSNDLFCAPVGDDFRCVGICDQQAADPDATCPEPNAICAFGEGDQGICLSGCDPAIGCGEPGLGCLPISNSPLGGMCVPTNDGNGPGQACSPDLFFDCAEGLLCIDQDGNGVGECSEVCRAFGAQQSDCSAGSYCLPVTPDFGLCFADNGSQQGDRCRPENTTCGDDAVGCFRAGMGGGRCQRLCRLDEGDEDCVRGTCRQFSPDQTEFGVCVGGN